MGRTNLWIESTNAENGAKVVSFQRDGGRGAPRWQHIVDALLAALEYIPERHKAGVWFPDPNKTLGTGARIALSPMALSYTIAEWERCPVVQEAIEARHMVVYGLELIEPALLERARQAVARAGRPPATEMQEEDETGEQAVVELPLDKAPATWRSVR